MSTLTNLILKIQAITSYSVQGPFAELNQPFRWVYSSKSTNHLYPVVLAKKSRKRMKVKNGLKMIPKKLFSSFTASRTCLTRSKRSKHHQAIKINVRTVTFWIWQCSRRPVLTKNYSFKRNNSSRNLLMSKCFPMMREITSRLIRWWAVQLTPLSWLSATLWAFAQWADSPVNSLSIQSAQIVKAINSQLPSQRNQINFKKLFLEASVMITSSVYQAREGSKTFLFFLKETRSKLNKLKRKWVSQDPIRKCRRK